MNIRIPIDWGNLIISVPIILGAVWGGIKLFAKKYVDQQFAKRLENHKHELNLIIENNKFDIQRKMYDFNLYTTKRHEVYMKLYHLFLEAASRANRLQGLRQIPDFKNYSNDELREYFNNFNLPESKKLSIIENWENGTNQELVKEVSHYYDVNEVKEMESAYIKAKNEYLISRLYLSKTVESICVTLSAKLAEAFIDLEDIYDRNWNTQGIDLRESRKNLRNILNDINVKISEIQEEMQKELSIGYYDNTR